MHRLSCHPKTSNINNKGSIFIKFDFTSNLPFPYKTATEMVAGELITVLDNGAAY